eukprot:CAMPEP_0174748378 /NCGR_PEP_ID=MMETSP1094-20130205/93316_1 /TAXON_ID=156173 /ORGANISM="Chrysochromulina brevifilum, Strain UTEX LB 985" /LENGTH=39 /DNA_ID= /DNA_START= /DNA_END= /DNA_ORIENTATION=
MTTDEHCVPNGQRLNMGGAPRIGRAPSQWRGRHGHAQAE